MMTATQSAREATMQPLIAELEAELVHHREEVEKMLVQLAGLQAYPSAKRSLLALERMREALAPIGQGAEVK